MEFSHSNIQDCVNALKRGACIAYPTEAVWGLGCNPSDIDAIKNILRIKQRPMEKGLILAAASIDQVAYLLEGIESAILEKMKQSWPGHVTWLVPHNDKVSPWVSGDSDKVAIRVSAHPVVQALCSSYGAAIVSTSANPAGLPSACTEAEVKHYFSEEPLVYAPGTVGSEARPSTIIDAHTGKVLRQ